jgi:hypothetical protein
MKYAIALLVAVAPSGAFAQLLPSVPAEHCVAAPPGGLTATAWLDRAAATVLPPSLDGRVLRYRASHDVPLWEQSDRSYEPYIPNSAVTQRWYDPATGVEARQPVERPLRPGDYPSLLTSASAMFAGRDTTVRALGPIIPNVAAWRLENPWIVLADWRSQPDSVRRTGRCSYRDEWRTVLERGDERLFLSESDGTPVKLERVEPHYLWGQTKVEYAWSTWWGVRGGGMFPYAAFRILDGTVYERIGMASGSLALMPPDSGPRLSVPPGPLPVLPRGPDAASPDTIRVADATYLLVTPLYTETVTLQRDTVFLLDATTGETRARGDSAMIAALFPGPHPLVVVVTDLAWPHISGVRFWVARGATIVSHAASEAFLRRVVERRWTLNPDALEQRRAAIRWRFRAVGDSLRLAGGALVVYPLRGTSAELAVGVWVPQAHFFWAGDFVQGSPESPYARDVIRTVRALGLAPALVGAQHIKVTAWSDLEARAFPVR